MSEKIYKYMLIVGIILILLGIGVSKIAENRKTTINTEKVFIDNAMAVGVTVHSREEVNENGHIVEYTYDFDTCVSILNEKSGTYYIEKKIPFNPKNIIVDDNTLPVTSGGFYGKVVVNKKVTYFSVDGLTFHSTSIKVAFPSELLSIVSFSCVLLGATIILMTFTKFFELL